MYRWPVFAFYLTVIDYFTNFICDQAIRVS